LVKEVAQTQQVDMNSSRQFKVIVFHEAESLSRDAQAALRRTMEKYMANLRVILCCTSTSKIIAPIRSRLLMIRIPSPTASEMTKVLKNVMFRENIEAPEPFIRRICTASQGNLVRALLMLEAAKVQQYPITTNQKIPTTDWELSIKEIASLILKDQSAANLLNVRKELYQLLANCIPADVIIKNLAFELMGKFEEPLKRQLLIQAAEYDHRLALGNKDIFHLEAFVAKIMSIYGQYLTQ
jgi:replication factor C subunit 3/5